MAWHAPSRTLSPLALGKQSNRAQRLLELRPILLSSPARIPEESVLSQGHHGHQFPRGSGLAFFQSMALVSLLDTGEQQTPGKRLRWTLVRHWDSNASSGLTHGVCESAPEGRAQARGTGRQQAQRPLLRTSPSHHLPQEVIYPHWFFPRNQVTNSSPADHMFFSPPLE